MNKDNMISLYNKKSSLPQKYHELKLMKYQQLRWKNGRDVADHSPQSNAEVKNCRIITPLPNTCSWRDV
jgi:hypothetical protein